MNAKVTRETREEEKCSLLRQANRISPTSLLSDRERETERREAEIESGMKVVKRQREKI